MATRSLVDIDQQLNDAPPFRTKPFY